MKKIIIAIDGYSSCGKSTMAKDLARDIGYIYIDTGAMYRAVTLYALRQGLFDGKGELQKQELESSLPDIRIAFRLNSETGRPETLLNGECVEKEVRGMEVSSHVSEVAALPLVREALVNQQRLMGKEKGIVMDGRDIGTVVFPHAELKVFVTASAQVRAERRYKELRAKGVEANLEDIIENVNKRDYIDTHREVSPLRKADDAVVLDNTNMTVSEQKQWLLDQYHRVVKE